MRYWKRVDEFGNTKSVEYYSFDSDILGATEITKNEYDSFIASIKPQSIEPTRDLASEIDAITARIKTLENIANR